MKQVVQSLRSRGFFVTRQINGRTSCSLSTISTLRPLRMKFNLQSKLSINIQSPLKRSHMRANIILSTREFTSSSGTSEVVAVPSMGDSISEGTVVEWVKSQGDYVEVDDIVVILETDKVSVDVRAPVSGAIEKTLADIDANVSVGSDLFIINTQAEKPTGEKSPSLAPAKEKSKATPPPPKEELKPKELPRVETPKPATLPPSSSPSPSKSTTSSSWGGYKREELRVPISGLKARAAERQKATQNTAAMLSTFQECDLGNLMALREELNAEFEKTHGVQIGIMSSFLKASAKALLEIPAVNSFVDMEAKEIIYNDYVDVNVAVASDKGVVMPVIRNVETMGIADLEKALAAYALQAKDGSLALEDLAGGTFTIANAGVFGSLLSTSLLTAPQSATLSIHGIKDRPAVAKNGDVVLRPMMFLSLTYDHRIIDGREGVTFLKMIADTIADPRRLILDL